jgi:hypothetical protein
VPNCPFSPVSITLNVLRQQHCALIATNASKVYIGYILLGGLENSNSNCCYCHFWIILPKLVGLMIRV